MTLLLKEIVSSQLIKTIAALELYENGFKFEEQIKKVPGPFIKEVLINTKKIYSIERVQLPKLME